MGKIGIIGMQFYAYHGYYKEERHLGGNYVVDVEIDSDMIDRAAADDQLNETINYESVYRIVKEQMSARSKLIEHVAKLTLDDLGAHFKNVKHLKIRVTKTNPPMQGNVDRVFVELEKKF
jgi:dihydroneopterin aldolase